MKRNASVRVKRSRRRPGAAPGTLVGHPDAGRPRVYVISYGPSDFVEAEVADVKSLDKYLAEWPVTWINVDGVGHVETIRALGKTLGLHTLALEDVVNLGQRPKVEEYDNHLFMVVRMIEAGGFVRTEQISMFLGERFVLTFQEHPGDCLDCVRKRIREGRGRVRSMGADYLVYSLLDAVVDAYFPHLDEISEGLEDLEREVISAPTSATVAAIHRAKRGLIAIRHATSPLREAINVLLREADPWITETTRIYLRDCYDHVVRISEAVDTHREVTGGLLDVYLSSVSNRMNEIMKVLTIIATVFIPLSFLAGVYGMNFDPDTSPWSMPELRWYWGYPVFLVVVIAVALIEIAFFWKKGWLGKSGIEEREDKTFGAEGHAQDCEARKSKGDKVKATDL